MAVQVPYSGNRLRRRNGTRECLSPEHHPHRIEPTTLKRYKEAYVHHFALWKQASQRQQVIMARVPSVMDLQNALHSEAIVLGALETY